MTAEQMRRVASLLDELNKIAREQSVYLTTMNPYVEVDGKNVGQLDWCPDEMHYELREAPQ